MTNQLVQSMIKELKTASIKNKAPIWSTLAKQAQKPGIAQKLVNITKINRVTADNDVVVIPGKVLGTGNISHKVTLCSFSILKIFVIVTSCFLIHAPTGGQNTSIPRNNFCRCA